MGCECFATTFAVCATKVTVLWYLHITIFCAKSCSDRGIADVTETDVFDDVPPSDDDEPNQVPFDLSSDELFPVFRLQPDSQKP